MATPKKNSHAEGENVGLKSLFNTLLPFRTIIK